MMLCRWNNNWYLTTGVSGDNRHVWLRCSREMPHPAEFQALPPLGHVYYGSVPLSAEVDFFPELRWRGLFILPEGWVVGTRDPILRCRLWGDKLFRGSELLRATGVIALREKKRKASIEEHPAIQAEISSALEAARQLEASLLDAGWTRAGREGFLKELHVDDIETTPGLPPVGAV